MSRISWNRSLKYIYIFCEWKTEEKYFKQLSRIVNKKWIIVKPIDLEWWTILMEHPETIKRKIINTLKQDNPKIKWLKPEVFIVFDLDIFIDKSKLQNTQNVLRNYKLIYNNECFEYWILSHFQKYDLWNWKKEYLNKIRKHLLNLPQWKDYKMTWDEDYDWLENTEKVEKAIEHTKIVNKYSEWKNMKDRDPYSNMYEIIEYLDS